MPTQRHSPFSTAAKNTTNNDANPTATPAPRSAQANTLPQPLQNTVPSCAQSCLDIYISQEYTSCPSESFSCLCSRYSSQGYTLGELAFICLQEQCPPSSQTQQVSLYDICSAASSAASPTHGTLTLPATTTSVPSVMTTTVDSARSSSASTTQSEAASHSSSMSSSPVTVAATSSAAIAGSNITPTISSSSTLSPTTTTSAAAAGLSHSTSLTSAQAVGVSVAAFGSMAVVIGIVYLVACMRRRKATKAIRDVKRDSYDFIDEEPPRFSPFNYGHADPRGPLGGWAHPRVELPSEKSRKSEWYRKQFPDPPPKEYAAAHGLDVGEAHSLMLQRSDDSMRTVSQLLPEKPGPIPPKQPPVRPSRSPRPKSFTSPATVFEEDKSPRNSTAQLPTMPKAPLPVRTGLPGKDVKNGQIPQFAAQYTISPEEVRAPALSLKIPRQASRTARIPSPTAFPAPPVPVEDPYTNDDRASRGSRAKSAASTTAGSLLNYYASPEAGSVPDFWEPEPTPISTDPQRRFKPVPAAIAVTKPTYPPRAVRSVRPESGTSDTSFESTDPDEPTPPEEEDKRLSAVAEHSPIAAVRYPKIPRSSNQSIPRSPPVKLSPGFARGYTGLVQNGRTVLPSQKRQKSGRAMYPPVTPERREADTSTLSGSTLGPKQSRDSAAREPQKKLVIDTSHSRANSHATARSLPRHSGDGASSKIDGAYVSPLKGYGRVTSGGRVARSGGRIPNGDHPAFRTADGLLTPEMKLQEVILKSPKSPLWEPKLTPSRRGDDLFLQVGLASPASVVDGKRAF